MIFQPSRKLSIASGLVIPEGSASKTLEVCSRHTKILPSVHEQQLAAKLHRWKEMRYIQAGYFEDVMGYVTDLEKKILDILQLPDIEDVRTSNKAAEPDGPEFEYTPRADVAIGYEIDNFAAAMTGEELFDIWMFQAFAVYAKRTAAAITSRLSGGAEARIGQLSVDNLYYEALKKEAGARIRKLTASQKEIVRKTLLQMAREGKGPMDAARWLHNTTIGEGAAWKYIRITRSETVLAGESAYNSICDLNGTRYDEWSATGGACYVCSALDGKVWEHGSGPEPVSYTHPHCVCVRIPLFTTDKPVQDKWARISPYKKPYKPKEIESFLENAK